MGTSKAFSVSLFVASSSTVITLFFLFFIGIVDRETSFSSWAGLPTAASTGFQPITLRGIPVYMQFQGLGYRLPMVSGITNSPVSFAAGFLDIDLIRSVLLGIATFAGMFSFVQASYHRVEVEEERWRRGVALRVICSAPLVAISFTYIVKNDWSDVAFGFWGSIATTFTMLRLVDQQAFKRSQLLESLTLLSIGFFFVCISYPWNWSLFVPLTLSLCVLLTRLIWRTRDWIFLGTLVPLAVFVVATFGQSLDMFWEYLSQSQSMGPRTLENGSLGGIVNLLLVQFGWLTTGREPYLAVFPIVISLSFVRRTPLSIASRTEAFIGCIVLVLGGSFTWLAEIPWLRAMLPSASFAFRDILLPLVLLWTIRSLSHILNTSSKLNNGLSLQSSKAALLGLCAIYFVLPLTSLLVNLGTVSPLSDPAVDELSSGTVRAINRGQLVYVNRSSWYGTDETKESFGPRQLQGAGIATINVLSKMRSNQILEPQFEVFEGGLQDEHCIWSKTARFLHVSYLVGTRFCEQSEPNDKQLTEVGGALWANLLVESSVRSSEICPLIRLPCLSLWEESGAIQIRDAKRSDFFRRCLERCVAEAQITEPGSRMLMPIRFDEVLTAHTSEGTVVPVEEFAGLLALDTSRLAKNTTLEISVAPDLRMNALVIAGYFKLLLLSFSLTFGFAYLVKNFRTTLRTLTSLMK